MTPDMVDGMGIAGTQGVFQRCAEETLRVLREGSQVIMTVLEVFKHDPLYSWYGDVFLRHLDELIYILYSGLRVKKNSGTPSGKRTKAAPELNKTPARGPPSSQCW